MGLGSFDYSETCSSTTSASCEDDYRRALAEKTAECENLRSAVAALTSALGEMNEELRVKATEVEALQSTVETLRDALKETDTALQATSVQREQLDLKLSAVTFYERGEKRDDDDEEKDRPIRRRNKRERLRQQRRVLKLLELEESDDEESDYDHEPPTLRTPPPPPPPPPQVPVLELPRIKEPQDVKEPEMTTDHASLSACVAPSQAAFYRVIRERDTARREADRLATEVRQRRDQVRKLRNKLSKSTALIELSYIEDEEESKPDSKQSSPMKWLKPRHHPKATSNEVSRTTLGPKLEGVPDDSSYVEAVAGDSADKAAGVIHARAPPTSVVESKLIHL